MRVASIYRENHVKIGLKYIISVKRKDKKKIFNYLHTNPTKWTNTLNCLSVFDLFVELALLFDPWTKISLPEKYPIWSFYLVHIFPYAEIYEVSLRILFEYRKIRTRKTPYLDTFHAVYMTNTPIFTNYSERKNTQNLIEMFHHHLYHLVLHQISESDITYSHQHMV